MHQTISKNRTWPLVFLTVSIVLLIANHLGMAQNGSMELKYDDGNYNLKLTLLVDATTFTTRFTPPAPIVQVEKIHFYVPDTLHGASCLLYIFDDSGNEPGAVLWGPTAIKGLKIGWNEYDLTESNLAVHQDFYVSLQYDQQAQLTIAAENHDPLSYRTYDTDC